MDNKEELVYKKQIELQQLEIEKAKYKSAKIALENEAEEFGYINTMVKGLISEMQEYWKGETDVYKELCNIEMEVCTYQKEIENNLNNRAEENRIYLADINERERECEKEYIEIKDILEK